ncbi:MAG: IclR family transcriptional regulator [Acetobacteraceae bacterium]
MQRPVNKKVAAGTATRYAAPALEKGLDILELLANQPGGIGQKALAEAMGRSVPRIFRMLSVLEDRGYVVRDVVTGHYHLTLKLFELGNRHPPLRRVLQAARPVMLELVEQIRQSCHLVVAHGDRILVVAEERPSLAMTFCIQLGASFPFVPHFVSARVLAACQPPDRRADRAARMAAAEGLAAARPLLARLERIAARGYDSAPSEVHDGIVDMSFPILDADGIAVAALTVPFLPQRGIAIDRKPLQAALAAAARQISDALGGPGPVQTPAPASAAGLRTTKVGHRRGD